MKNEPIAVVGISSVFPGSGNTGEFWDTIFQGKDRITDVPQHYWLTQDYFDPDPRKKGKTYARRGGFLPKQTFDPDIFRIPPKTISSIDTVQLLALICARRLVDNCPSIRSGKVDKKNISVILGGGTATEMMAGLMGHIHYPNWRKAMRECNLPEPLIEEIFEKVSQTYPEITENSFPGSLGNITAGRIANRLDLGGSNCVVDAACASSLAAVSSAIQSLRLNTTDLVITGGADAHNDIFMFMCFSKTPALSPTGDCRPFSKEADGTILGEGVGLLALKRLTDAQKEKDPIYGVIRGSGSSSDGLGKSIYAPQASGQALAIERAYRDAGTLPGRTELVEAHGTATRANDATEFKALCQTFSREDSQTIPKESGRAKPAVQWCGLGSVKSQIGHTKSAAGAAALIKMVLALHHKILPPTIKADTPNPALKLKESPFYLNTIARPWIHEPGTPRQGSLSAFGFGGSNFHLVVQEYLQDKKSDNNPARRYHLFPSQLILAGGKDINLLAEKIAVIEHRLKKDDPLCDIAHDTQMTFNYAAKFRLTLTAGASDQAMALLEKAKKKISEDPDTPFSISNCLHFGPSPWQDKVAFLFPGQGSQYLHMGADLAMAFSQARGVWDAISGEPETHGLHQRVFPPPPLNDEEKKSLDQALAQTSTAQPAIGAVTLSMLRLMQKAGIHPDCTAGHSFGELLALFCAGAIPLEKDLMALAKIRGDLMAGAADPNIPTGMTAVMAEKEKITSLIKKEALNLIIANENSPGQFVLSGTSEQLDIIEFCLRKERISFQRLPVSMAFHSEVVSPLSQEFLRALNKFDFHPPEIPVYANTTGEAYPYQIPALREQMAGQIANPVLFTNQVEAMYRDGVRLFVEVGPGSTLTGLVNRCLGERPHKAVALDPKGPKDTRGFWNLMGILSAAGILLDFSPFWKDIIRKGATPKETYSSFAVEIDGSNFEKPYPPKGGSEALPPPVYRDAARYLETIPSDEPLGQDQENQNLEILHTRMKQAHEAFIHASSAFMNKMAQQKPDMDTATEEALPPDEHHIPTPIDESVYQKALIKILTEKTGYPEDIFDLDTELEAGYGIDSIKKVEILAEFLDQYPDLELGDTQQLYGLLTLGDIITHVRSIAGSKTGKKQEVPISTPPEQEPRSAAPVKKAPFPPLLRYQVELEEIPGIPGSFKGKDSLWHIIKDRSGTAKILAEQLVDMGIKTILTKTCPPDADHIIFLPGIDKAKDASSAIDINYQAFEAAKACAPNMKRQDTCFVLVQDTGGDFNLSGSAGIKGWSGGLSGLAKTAAMEWPKARVKSIDLPCSTMRPKEIAAALIQELHQTDDRSEVGLTMEGSRVKVTTRESSDIQKPSLIEPDQVVVVTGGARGITRECIITLAQQVPMKFAILGRSDPDVDGAEEIQETMAALEQNGSQVRYFCADVTDPGAVESALEDVRALLGPIDILIHGAGIIDDAPIHEKELETFKSVFDTKVQGFLNLLKETGTDPLKRICCFSSIVARQGNFNQSDYAMANEVLNKVCQSEAVKREGACIVRSINWGPWDGGMVQDHHKTLFRTMGIGLISSDQGTRAFVNEFGSDTQGPVEIIITGNKDKSEPVSVLGAEQTREWVMNRAEHLWVNDHSPTYCIPVLPMMGELDMLCSQGSEHLSRSRAVQVISLASNQWAAFSPETLEGRTRIREEDTNLLSMEFQIRDKSENGYAPAVTARIRFANTYPLAPKTQVPRLEMGYPVKAPYKTGQLFHGPGLQLMDKLVLGTNGADCIVRCESRGVPYGSVHPGLLDAALHCMPSQQMHLWFPKTGEGNIAFPMELSELAFYRDLPRTGFVHVRARTNHLANRYFPIIQFWIFEGTQLAAEFSLKLLLVPKGPLVNISPISWKRFLKRSGHISGLVFGSDTGTLRQARKENIKAMDWLPGTIASVFRVSESEKNFYTKVALKAHAGDLMAIHPSRVSFEPATGSCRNLPLNRLSVSATETKAFIETAHKGIEALDLSSVKTYWHEKIGVKHSILSDLFEGFVIKFIRRIVLESPDEIQACQGKPVMFMSNHQTGVETPLMAIFLGYLFNSPIYGITNKEQQNGILGHLNQLVKNSAGTRLPFHMRVFDQEKRLQLSQILYEIADKIKTEAASLYIACEGRRAFRAGHKITQLSSLFIDFLIEHQIPVVPIRFTGGLPVKGPDIYYDFPYGYGQQDIYLGRIIRPETLADLAYGQRPEFILDRINSLGPELEKETPLGPDKNFETRVNTLSKALGIPKMAAAAAACLDYIESPSRETKIFMDSLKTNGLTLPEPGTELHDVLSFLLSK